MPDFKDAEILSMSVSFSATQLQNCSVVSKYLCATTYSLIQKNGDTFDTVSSSKCVTVFWNQTIFLKYISK